MLACFEAASGTTVPRERFDRMVECALHLGMKLLVLQPLAGDPFGRGHQRRLAFQMSHIPVACALAAGIQRDDGFEHVNGRQRGIDGLERLQCLSFAATSLSRLRPGGGNQWQRRRRRLCQLGKGLPGAARLVLLQLQCREVETGACRTGCPLACQ